MQLFEMERWQSHHENEVRWNLSESGVHPLSLRELLALGGESDGVLETRLGYGHSNGSPALRERIAALYPGAEASQVVVTNGSAEANFVVAWRLVEPGDEVAVLTPTYMQLPGLADSLGARVRAIPLRPEHDWQPDPADLDAGIGSDTRLVVVTNPQNPTGVVLRDEAMEAVIAAAERVGAWVLADEVYAGAEADGPATATLFGRSPRVVATGSLSKAYGLPGLRIGWIVAPPRLTEDLWARKDYTTISPGPLTDGLAALALREDVRPRIIERSREIIRQHRQIVRAWAEDSGVFRFGRHDAGAVCLLAYDLPLGSMELAERLLAEEDVLLVPGAHFGLGSYVRIGFGIERAPLEEALARVGDFVSR